ncbi:hypothetical protein ACIRPH_31590 [Nocardiopsis sp. NPDC101807]|uniref:hypothetical protein n=1 Tax=Nocardiopsis sp. NPDC101807 TaxID=3364339 RepID=UPI00381BED90
MAAPPVPHPAPLVRVRGRYAVLVAWVGTPRRGLRARITWVEREAGAPARWRWETAEVDAAEVEPLRGQLYRYVPREDRQDPGSVT